MCWSALTMAVVVCVAVADEPWTPPENPNPSVILQEAQADKRAQKYEQALAKHVWFHRNALKHQPAQAGVRLSFALTYWKQLAAVYPPALVKMIEIRYEAAADVLAGIDARQSFQDLAALNKTLDEELLTKDVFASLHKEKPDVAKQVFSLARPALIKAAEYQLCGGYLEPEKNSQQAIGSFQTGKRLAQDPKLGERHLDFVNKKFTNDMTTLVALLVVNGRQTVAATIAADAKKEWDDANFQKAIDEALKGVVPAPWP